MKLLSQRTHPRAPLLSSYGSSKRRSVSKAGRRRDAGPAGSGALAVPTGCALLLALAAASACSRPAEHGPIPLQWDRANCERCSMAIGERRFAVEIRGAADRRIHVFDDLGCALLWLGEHRAQEGPSTEIWVRDPLGAHWIDAHTAHFTDGHPTPMGYGFAVAATPSRGDVSAPTQSASEESSGAQPPPPAEAETPSRNAARIAASSVDLARARELIRQKERARGHR